MSEEKRIQEKTIHENSKRKIIIGSYPSSTGEEMIYYKKSLPIEEEESCLHFFLLHDFGDYHARYLLLANILESHFGNKIKFTWIDFKGHGLSTGTRGHLSCFTEYCLDLANGLNYAMEEGGDKEKYFIVGQGVGALTAMKLYHLYYRRLHNKISGMISLNPALKLNLDLPHWAEMILQDIVLGKNISKFKMPYYLDGKNFSDDEVLADAYNRDPLITHKLTFSYYQQVIKAAMIVRASSYFIDIPSLIFVGEEDVFCDPEVTKLFFKGMPKAHSKLIVYPEEKHDMLNGAHRDKVYEDITRWIVEHQ